ncbi:hypothetical protein ACS0TY_026931 [Phlomoides rotata]
MKADLKEWSKKTFGLIDLKIEEKKAEILNLHLIDDTFGLEEEEIIKRNQGSAELLRELHWNDGMLAQKDKAKWIAVGDTNSRFFHRLINKRHKQNGIEGLMVNNIWVDSVEGVKKGVFQHFSDHFRSNNRIRPLMDSCLFQRQIQQCDNTFLEARLMGLNMDSANLQYMADILSCEVGLIPFSYLGLNVGINHKRAASWEKLVEKIRRRLALWNDKHISLGVELH